MPAAAQQEAFHWAYAAYFGTGRYTLDGRTETVVLSVAPGWTGREPGLSAAGERRIGYRMGVPVSIGAAEFSSLDQIDDISLDGLDSVSVVPGVEIEIPMSERWRLKSLAYAGLGTEMRGGVDARIFRLGFRSELGFELGDIGMRLVNGVGRFGYSAGDGHSSALNLIETGLDFSRPLERRQIADTPIALHWHVLYTRYPESLGLDPANVARSPVTIGSEWELGFAFGKQTGELSLWRLKFDRFGLAYRFGADGEFSGVGLVFRSLFDR